ncbi:hypothetical protein H0H93_012271 [Arthromyces matolae]|nr:hypothetical protein H0H93_012271 [Arthromyces matolae]
MSDVESAAPTSRPPSPISALPNTARPYRFNWDPAARRPGPESVSGTTDGRGANDYFTVQPKLGLYPSQLNLALGALPQEWSSATHGFHAISTVLNNPHKRQAPPKAHSHLPPVVPADLPRVRRKDFDSYLRAVAPEWERFQQSSSQGRDGVPHLDDNTPLTLPSPTSVPPLDIVPQVFFEHSFSLPDPRTFNTVTADADPTALADALPLLEKFSHYADTVEQHLILEISHRAPSFFAALTNLHDLHAESEHCLQRIASLRGLLTDLDNNSAKKGLDLVRRQARATNIATVADALKQINSVVEMGRVARALVGAGQWGQALGVIEVLDSMWQDPTVEPERENKPLMPTLSEEDEEHGTQPIKKSPHIPLSSLRAYSALPIHLHALTMEIAASLSSELVSVLRDDLTQRKDQDSDADLRDRLRPLLQGLIRTRGIKEGLLSWREVVLGVIRQVVRSRLPKDDESEEAKSLNRTHFRDMRHPEFILLLQGLYADFLKYIEGIQSQSNVILSILESDMGKIKGLGPPPTASSATSLTPSQIQDELTDILASAAELSNTQSASLIAYRQEEHSSLELADFLAFFNDSWAFVVRCEVLSRRMIVGLRGVVVGQAKSFLMAFHQKRITSSAKLVEDEQWNPAEISAGLQRITDAIVDSAVKDAPELVIKAEGMQPAVSAMKPQSSSYEPSEPLSQHHKDTQSQMSVKPNGTGTVAVGGSGFSTVKATGSKQLRIEDRTYFAVNATTEVLVLLLDYLRVVVNLSMLTTDVMSRIIEFLKAFNSRTCQVVLGAGAMRSAGLKNITAKHLALASQSLSIMFELIPYVRETFRRHLSPKQAVMLVEFDKLKRDYQEHQNEIHSKLIAIMGDRLNAHIRTLQAVDWNIPKPGGGVNDYVEVLVKETVTLHKVLSRYLSVPVVEVFAAINHGLSEEYNKIELPNQEAKTRLLADAKYLHQKLSALKNVAAPSGMLVTVVSEKSLPRTGPPSPLPAPVPTPTRSNTLGSANQRLKGLLSGRSPTFDKALPTPLRSSSSMVSPPLNGHREEPRRPWSTSSTSSPTIAGSRKASSGFKQVEEPIKGPSGGNPDPGQVLSMAGPKEAEKDPEEDGGQRHRRRLSPPLPPTPHDTPTPPLELAAAPETEPGEHTAPRSEETGKVKDMISEVGNGNGPDVGSGGEGTDVATKMSDGPGTRLDGSEVPAQSEIESLELNNMGLELSIERSTMGIVWAEDRIIVGLNCRMESLVASKTFFVATFSYKRGPFFSISSPITTIIMFEDQCLVCGKLIHDDGPVSSPSIGYATGSDVPPLILNHPRHHYSLSSSSASSWSAITDDDDEEQEYSSYPRLAHYRSKNFYQSADSLYEKSPNYLDTIKPSSSALSYARRPSGTNNRTTVSNPQSRTTSVIPRNPSSIDDDGAYSDIGFSSRDESEPEIKLAPTTQKSKRSRASLPAYFSLLQITTRRTSPSSSSNNTISRVSPPTPKVSLAGISISRGRRRVTADLDTASRSSSESHSSPSPSRSSRRPQTQFTIGLSCSREADDEDAPEPSPSPDPLTTSLTRGRPAVRRNSSPPPAMMLSADALDNHNRALAAAAMRPDGALSPYPQETRGRLKVDVDLAAPGFGIGRSGLLHRERVAIQPRSAGRAL